MKFNVSNDSGQILAELSKRTQENRINYPMTQKELAEKSGVSFRSIQNFEKGSDIQLTTFLKLLIALDLSENINLLLPDVSKRSSMYLSETKKYRVRKSTKKEANKPFVWGEDK